MTGLSGRLPDSVSTDPEGSLALQLEVTTRKLFLCLDTGPVGRTATPKCKSEAAWRGPKPGLSQLQPGPALPSWTQTQTQTPRPSPRPSPDPAQTQIHSPRPSPDPEPDPDTQPQTPRPSPAQIQTQLKPSSARPSPSLDPDLSFFFLLMHSCTGPPRGAEGCSLGSQVGGLFSQVRLRLPAVGWGQWRAVSGWLPHGPASPRRVISGAPLPREPGFTPSLD